MGKLYDMRLTIEKTIESKKLDGFNVKGKISMKSGLVLALLKENTPDDPEKIEKLQFAAREVLNINI